MFHACTTRFDVTENFEKFLVFGLTKGVFGTALLYVFQLRSTFFSQTVSAPHTQFEKKE